MHLHLQRIKTNKVHLSARNKINKLENLVTHQAGPDLGVGENGRTLCVKLMSTYSAWAWWVNNLKCRYIFLKYIYKKAEMKSKKAFEKKS